LRLIGGFRGWPIQWNHVQCCGPTPVAMATTFGQIWAIFRQNRPSVVLYARHTRYVWAYQRRRPAGPTFVAKATTSETGTESHRLPACLFVCMSVTLIQIDSSSLFLDGIEPFLGHQLSMTKATKRCSSNFDMLPWQRNLGYFCKNFKLLLFCFWMESSHFWKLVLRDPLYKTLFFDF